MVYMKGQIENLEWESECEGEWMNGWACKWIDCERKLWRMVKYPWGAAKLYSIRKDLVE